MSNSCPVNCPHCMWDDRDEAEERAIRRQMREENDANFTDQDISEDEVASLMGVEPYR